MAIMFDKDCMKIGDMIKKIDHYPQLDTVLKIERAIKESDEPLTKTGLYKKLEEKVMYKTILVVLAYLMDSGKIVMKNNKIIWIHDPEGVKKFKERAKKKELKLK